MGLYQKYRPRSFSAMLGNEDIINSLERLINDPDKRPHSYLFHGPTGCGKTTLGRIVTQELECSDQDFREVDSADFRGIDTVREIRKQSQFHPIDGSVRVFLIDECHKLTGDAQNALLKILEDTPSHVYFILCTTEPQKLLPTIKGRCSQYQVKPLSENEMNRLLKRIARKEEVEIETEVIEQITMDSFGLPRNAINILEQVLSADPEQRLKVARQSAEQQSQSIELCRALIQGSGWKKIRGVLDGLKDQDPESVRRHVLGYCQSVLLKDDNERAGWIMEQMVEPFYNSGFAGLVFACYSIVKLKDYGRN